MNFSDIETKYVVIGNNKRLKSPNAESLMGRKGVGKLAALFLTKKFAFETKKESEEKGTWIFDFLDRTQELPALVSTEDITFVMHDKFETQSSGTLLRLYDVNLTNMAEEAINGLSLIMGNYFLYEKLPKVNVRFYVKNNSETSFNEIKPIEMHKNVAFNNMLSIICDNDFFKKLESSQFNYPLEYGDYFDEEFLTKNRKQSVF